MTKDNGFRVQTPDEPNNHTDKYRVYRPEDPQPAIAHSTHSRLEEAQAECQKMNAGEWGWS